MDKYPERWRQRITRESYPWQHVLDLDNGENKVAAMYGIHKFPTYFLIDQEGNLIGKYHDRYELEKVLQTEFGW